MAKFRPLVAWVLLAGAACLLPPLRAQVPGAAGVAGVSAATSLLSDARAELDGGNASVALRRLDAAVDVLRAADPADGEARSVLVQVLELRARIRITLGDYQPGEADFRALLTLSPEHRLTEPFGPAVRTAFDRAKAAIVGHLALTVSPPDAELSVDGLRLSLEGGPASLVAGPHALRASRRGFREDVRTVVVEPAKTQTLAIDLERIAALIRLRTVPPGVEVVVDGQAVGTTLAGQPPQDYAEFAREHGVTLSDISEPLVFERPTTGDVPVVFRRPCYATRTQTLSVDALRDISFAPVVLEPARASLSIEGPPGAEVMVDGEAQGRSPASLTLCEGERQVVLRSPAGRHAEVISAKAGASYRLNPVLRPVLALLDAARQGGTPFVGADPREEVARLLRPRALILTVPSGDQVRDALAAGRLDANPHKLARDAAGIEVAGEPSITELEYRGLSELLAERLDAHAVATLLLPERSSVFKLAILAARSSVPDVLDLDLRDPKSISDVVASLDRVPQFSMPTVGLSVADVEIWNAKDNAEAVKAVVVGVVPESPASRAQIAPGDQVVYAGTPITSAGALAAAQASWQAGQQVEFSWLDGKGVTQSGRLAVEIAPRLISMADRSWHLNVLASVMRSRLAASDDPIVRLNLAVAMMGVRSFDAALEELRKTALPSGRGVSLGTVKYLEGLCLERVSRYAEAREAYRAAAAETGSLLTEDGPAVKALAEDRLAALPR